VTIHQLSDTARRFQAKGEIMSTETLQLFRLQRRQSASLR